MNTAKQVPCRHLASLHDDGAPSIEPSSSRFALMWPLEPSQSFHTPLGHTLERSTTLSSSEGESDHSEKETLSFSEGCPQEEPPGDHDVPTSHRPRLQQPLPLPPSDRVSDFLRPPRVFSTPLPSQLEHLRNPCRLRSPPSPALEMPSQPATPQYVPSSHDLALELADSVQMVVQTLLQISPAQILDPAKEQYAACSLLMPTTCISAVLTTMKNLNFLSANESKLFGSSLPIGNEQDLPSVTNTPETGSDFDIGETLQAVGDALSGCSAQAGVDLVLFHSDVGLKHVAVRGEEFALSNTLTHIIRQVVNTARPGDSIDVGLSIRSFSDESNSPTEESISKSGSASSLDVLCTFEITHHFEESDMDNDMTTPTDPEPCSHRPLPNFRSQLLQRLFLRTGASFVCDLPKRNNLLGRVYDISFRLASGDPRAIHTRTTSLPDGASPLLSGARVAREPSLEDLYQFSETLRGKKATLYANGTSSFAHHLTSYLTAWGLDVSHISAEQDGETSNAVEAGASPVAENNSQGSSTPYSKHRGKQWNSPESHNTQENIGASNGGARGPSVSFVFIDDDMSVLLEQIQRFRTEQQPSTYTMYSRKRPSLAANHRPKSSSQVVKALGHGTPSTPPSTVVNVVVHFTSLANYKMARDIIQRDLATHATSFQPPLEIMIIPKPAGPRRFLTALHTALTKPLVDPLFAPIATTPITPTIHSSPFFSHCSQQASPRSPLVRPWTSTRPASDRSARSPRDGDPHVLHPPSPLSIADTAEYFPDGSVKLGTAPASGLVFASPDGQPAGIVFNPRAKSKSSATPPDKSGKLQFLMPKPERLRGPATLQPADTNEGSSPQFPLSFAALHSAGHHSSQDHVQSPTQPLTPTPTSAMAKVRKSSVLADDVVQVTSPTVTLSRRGSPVEARKVASQPSSPNPAESPTSWFARRKARKAAQNQKLAMEAAANNASSKMTSENPIVPPISVLIVDDNSINRTILSTFMKKKKVKYDVAKNGEEAVEKWRTGNFQLILMDIQMPVMDGITATQEIRNMESLKAASAPLTPQSDGSGRTPRTPPDDLRTSPYPYSVIIVALTASSLESDRVAALAAGCNDFLTKPVSLKWLNNKLIEWGAIKALQMWADRSSEDERTFLVEQSAQAQAVARRLYVPENRGAHPDDGVDRTSSKDRANVTSAATSLTTLPPTAEKNSGAPPRTDERPAHGLVPHAIGGNETQNEESTGVSVIEPLLYSDDVDDSSSVVDHKATASDALANDSSENASSSTSASTRDCPLDVDAKRQEP